MYPDPLVHEGLDRSLMALLLLHRGILESEGHVDRGAVTEIFCLSIVWLASLQDKQIVGRQMVPLFFFLTFCIFCCLVGLVKVVTASCYLKSLRWHLPA